MRNELYSLSLVDPVIQMLYVCYYPLSLISVQCVNNNTLVIYPQRLNPYLPNNPKIDYNIMFYVRRSYYTSIYSIIFLR